MENQSNNPEIFDHNQQSALPNATATLVLGIISIVTCWCYGIIGVTCGIIGIVLANKDLSLYNAAPTRYSAGSYSNLKAGRVCSIIGLILSVLYILLMVAIIVTVGMAGLSDPKAWLNR